MVALVAAHSASPVVVTAGLAGIELSINSGGVNSGGSRGSGGRGSICSSADLYDLIGREVGNPENDHAVSNLGYRINRCTVSGIIHKDDLVSCAGIHTIDGNVGTCRRLRTGPSSRQYQRIVILLRQGKIRNLTLLDCLDSNGIGNAPRAGIYLLDGVLIKRAVRDSLVRVGINNGRSCVGVLLGYRHGGVGGVVISNGLRKACTFFCRCVFGSNTCGSRVSSLTGRSLSEGGHGAQGGQRYCANHRKKLFHFG